MGSKSDKPAARLGDIASNHGPWPPTPIIAGSSNVLINGRPAARQGDSVLLHAIPNHKPHGRSIAEGSGSVLINGKPAARVSDAISCGGKVAIGSGNVLIGDSPQLLKPEPVKIPRIDFGESQRRLAKNKQATASDSLSISSDKEVKYTSTSSPLDHTNASTASYWQDQKDNADNFPAYLAAHLMGLNAETGYSIAEGLAATFEIVTDKDKFLDTMTAVKEITIDAVTDPMGTYTAVKKAAVDFSELPLSEQGDALYKASLDVLAGGAGLKSIDSLATLGKKARRKDKSSESNQQETISNKRLMPGSLAEAEARLAARREDIAKAGYSPKYIDDELVYLAQDGDIGSERFQVRFMEASYLQARETPDIPLSGALGGRMKTETGEGIKYWSTSFDQLEDADSDPKLIAQKLGLTYKEGANYSLVIVDTHKAAPLTGVKSVSATFDEISGFSNTELPGDFPKSFTDKAMTSEFQAVYADQYSAAKAFGAFDDDWSVNSFDDYLQATDLSPADRKLMKQRFEMHRVIGNNEDYLGDGLTKNNNPIIDQQYGVVETFNFERNITNLQQLKDADAISIVTLEPL